MRSRDGQAQRARHQRLGLVDQQIVLVVAVLVGHFERVAEALGGEEGDLGAAALDHGVGRERGAVHDHSYRVRCKTGDAEQLRDAVQHRDFRGARRGQKLEAELAIAMLQDEIREGPADIDSEPRFLHTAYKTCADAGVKIGGHWVGGHRACVALRIAHERFARCPRCPRARQRGHGAQMSVQEVRSRVRRAHPTESRGLPPRLWRRRTAAQSAQIGAQTLGVRVRHD